jgi:hypothetical protein
MGNETEYKITDESLKAAYRNFVESVGPQAKVILDNIGRANSKNHICVRK